MARLRELLDSQGEPPPEICLDWIWQLRALMASRIDAPLTWGQIEVLPSGELNIIGSSGDPDRKDSDDQSATTAQDLIDQLLVWSGTGHAENSQAPMQLEQRTTALAPIPIGGIKAQESLAQKSLVEHASSQSAKTPPKALPTQKAQKSKSKVQYAWTGGVALVAASCLGFMFWPKPSVGVREPNASNTERIGNEPENQPRNHSQEDVTTEDTLGELQLSQTPDTDFAPTLSRSTASEFSFPTTDLAADVSSGIALPSLGDDRTEVINSDATLQAVGEVAQDADMETTKELAEMGLPATADMPSLESLVKSGVDVMAEMDRVTQQAEKLEQENGVPDAAESGAAQPALMLATSPMLQLQKPTSATAARVRKPEWRIRLVAGEGFQVFPPDAQVLAGREVVRWLIVDENAKSPKTQIGVTAMLLNPRTPSIRWRIVAGADDLPQAFVPMGKDYLDAMQRSLGQAGQQLNVQIEQLKAMGKATGIPSAVRSAMSAQRREWESQLSMSKRVLEIVADANQLEGWIDGEIEMHAELLDQAKPGSPPVLQFGTLEEPMEATAETPEVDERESET